MTSAESKNTTKCLTMNKTHETPWVTESKSRWPLHWRLNRWAVLLNTWTLYTTVLLNFKLKYKFMIDNAYLKMVSVLKPCLFYYKNLYICCLLLKCNTTVSGNAQLCELRNSEWYILSSSRDEILFNIVSVLLVFRQWLKQRIWSDSWQWWRYGIHLVWHTKTFLSTLCQIKNWFAHTCHRNKQKENKKSQPLLCNMCHQFCYFVGVRIVNNSYQK